MLSEAGQFYGVLIPKIIYPKLINIAIDAFNEIDERCSKENVENYLGSLTNTSLSSTTILDLIIPLSLALIITTGISLSFI